MVVINFKLCCCEHVCFSNIMILCLFTLLFKNAQQNLFTLVSVPFLGQLSIRLGIFVLKLSTILVLVTNVFAVYRLLTFGSVQWC